jgi:hypothetical protein
MKAKLSLALLTLGLLTVAGCDGDRSGETQSMPKSASAPNESPKPPATVPSNAQDAIGRAAPGGYGSK